MELVGFGFYSVNFQIRQIQIQTINSQIRQIQIQTIIALFIVH